MTDLHALFAAWFRDPAQQHKLMALIGAALRAHTDALLHVLPESGVGMSDKVLMPEITCTKCNARGHFFVCSTPGCPANSGVAYSASTSGAPAADVASGRPVGCSRAPRGLYGRGRRHSGRLVREPRPALRLRYDLAAPVPDARVRLHAPSRRYGDGRSCTIGPYNCCPPSHARRG